MDDTDLRTMMEELGIPSDKAEELILAITQHPDRELTDKFLGLTSGEIATMQEAIDSETDWRKKAAKAAQLISMKIDKGYE